jgi:hypothetical protein
MTPRMRRDFEARWPELAQRVDNLLKRKQVPASQRDDIIQETALRLIQMWGRVDVLRAPSLAVTVALNLLRDESRRRGCVEMVGEIPEIVEPLDVEAAGLARVELEKLRTAMTQLSAAQRSALLTEIGNGNGHKRTAGAEKMLRMRARKKLRVALERVSAPLLLKLRKTADYLHIAGAGPQENLMQGLACIGCIAIGLTVAAPQGMLAEHDARAPAIAEQSAGESRATFTIGKSAVRAGRTVAPPRVGATHRAENQVTSSGKNERSGATGSDRPSTVHRAEQPGAPGTAVPPGGGTPALPIDEPDPGIDEPEVPAPPDADPPDPGLVGVAPSEELPDVPAVPHVSVPEPQPPALPE